MAPSQPRSGGLHLSPELLVLIAEALRDEDYRSLFSLRLTSRLLNSLVTPVLYHILELTNSLTAVDAVRRFPRVLEHISRYTSHVVIRSDPVASAGLGSRDVVACMPQIPRLRSVTWRFDAHLVTTQRTLWLMRQSIQPQDSSKQTPQLYIEGLTTTIGFDLTSILSKSTSAPRLMSLKLGRPPSPMSTDLSDLKGTLLASPDLKVLHYRDRGQGRSFDFKTGERLPALKELILDSYDWNHSAADVKRNWNFSKLRSLQLKSVPIFNFLTSVDPHDLGQLHTLYVEDWSAHLPDRRRDAARGLYMLVKDHIQALNELDVFTHVGLFPIDAITRHKRTLRVLRLRDHVGFGDETSRCPTLSAADVAILARSLPHVHKLELDMDTKTSFETNNFLQAIGQFPRLHTLSIHTQTQLRAYDIIPPDSDPDFAAASLIFSTLMRGRQQQQRHDYRPSWKSIIINIGGWKRVMVRRLDAAWQEQNERGIFAERCFVLERHDDGVYRVREEDCIEARSSGSTPELAGS